MNSVVPVIDYKKIRVPPKQYEKLLPAFNSWRSMHPYIAGLSDNTANLNMLSAMLSMELNSHRPRLQIVTRLHMKINAMRREMEISKVLACVKD